MCIEQINTQFISLPVLLVEPVSDCVGVLPGVDNELVGIIELDTTELLLDVTTLISVTGLLAGPAISVPFGPYVT